MLWNKKYRYKKDDYQTLIRALKRPNRYQYALLLPERPSLAEVVKGRFRVFALPEGFLVLSRCPRIRIPGGHLELQDLTQKPLRLLPYILFIPSDSKRIRLQINRDYLRLLIKRISAISSRKHWYGGKRKFQKDYLKAVNEITREVNDIASTCFIYPQTIRSYNKNLRKYVLRFLTSVLGMKAEKAKKIMTTYLTTLKH